MLIIEIFWPNDKWFVYNDFHDATNLFLKQVYSCAVVDACLICTDLPVRWDISVIYIHIRATVQHTWYIHLSVICVVFLWSVSIDEASSIDTLQRKTTQIINRHTSKENNTNYRYIYMSSDCFSPIPFFVLCFVSNDISVSGLFILDCPFGLL
jgi:hypothetical protein